MGEPLKYRTDFDKHVVTCNFERRGWERWDPRYDDHWHVFWASVSTIKQIFAPENGIRLGDHQIVNHFPNHYELTRKDLMVKNITRWRKACEKEAALEANGAGQSNGNYNNTGMSATELLPKLDFVPATFSLPSDYSLFVEEFRRRPDRTWIMKPVGGAQGKGIFLINKLTQIKKWSNGYAAKDGSSAQWKSAEERRAENDKTESYIVSRYVQDPLLIGGKKFDLRVYVVVTSYRPLRAFTSRLGFARFCSVSYSEAKADMDNPFVHLTNVAIQKRNDDYNESHGNKWPIHLLRLYIAGTRSEAAADELFRGINEAIIYSLKSVQNVIINDRRCFELYGYDLLIDESLKPWLIEVNASPSLACTTEDDRRLKDRVIRDTLAVAVPPGKLEASAAGVSITTAMSRLSRGGRSNSVDVTGDAYEKDWARNGGVPESVLGTMDVLIDETGGVGVRDIVGRRSGTAQRGRSVTRGVSR